MPGDRMSREQVITIVKRMGFRRNSHNWQEYEAVKMMIGDRVKSYDEYEQAMRIVAEYLGL